MNPIDQRPTSGQDTAAPTSKLALPPEIIEEANRDLEALGKILDRPNDPSRLLSQLAIRSDGVCLISLEDAADLNLEKREIVSMMILTPDERAFLMDSAREFLDDRAARVLGKLPRREV